MHHPNPELGCASLAALMDARLAFDPAPLRSCLNMRIPSMSTQCFTRLPHTPQRWMPASTQHGWIECAERRWEADGPRGDLAAGTAEGLHGSETERVAVIRGRRGTAETSRSGAAAGTDRLTMATARTVPRGTVDGPDDPAPGSCASPPTACAAESGCAGAREAGRGWLPRQQGDDAPMDGSRRTLAGGAAEGATGASDLAATAAEGRGGAD